ncbi:GYDIA family GHMP kinase [Nonlabens ulvanivorans]|uniref:GYDIA family GHMP kinase n=1 Tax=Nonlabens ulvanivorans TaxID=906888 RepID=UPI0037CC2465
MNKEVIKKKYSAHGKFLITGEYVVLDNVSALAMPLKLNQYLTINSRNDGQFAWKSYDYDGSLWFEATLDLNVLKNLDTFKSDNAVTVKLVEILRKAIELHPQALDKMADGFNAITTLDFNRKYGMGTSSTLISLIAQWLECDAYMLQFDCFGGSGYDIACATENSRLIYNYNNGQPIVEPFDWNPTIMESIFFVYLNRKQNSRDSIARFDNSLITDELRKELDEMPQRFKDASNDVAHFNEVINRHEAIISSLIGLEPVKQKLFPDYTQAIKSLGGWGGDFIMCTGDIEERAYFKSKGFEIVLEWDDVVSGN